MQVSHKESRRAIRALVVVLIMWSVLLWLGIALNVWGALPACGTERWDVKTLSDLDAQRLDSVLLTDVSNLGRIVRPPGWSIDRKSTRLNSSHRL